MKLSLLLFNSCDTDWFRHDTASLLHRRERECVCEGQKERHSEGSERERKKVRQI
ncbi:hypothetical protein RchiOBHm_Chr1g0351721 [Rosa chinensis]|uniref:Uncharacterized protein n=1 Tax=Rosa chinensis TaxID=74649 RepID=A0A2P6SGF1_ROSCH|nr:hypothetical protein RchiOBHm_Chr1g0351721 [Rosa chinensis]